MSSPPQPTPTEKQDYRPEFTKFLDNPANLEKANGVTLLTVGWMNKEMVRNKVPMSRVHYEAASQSIRNGDPICTFLTNENKHVLDSKGNGMVYNAGYKFHSAVKVANDYLGSDTIPKNSGKK